MAFGFSTTTDYSHYIHTRHVGGGSSVNNAMDFYTSNGTQASSFPNTAVHGMSINGGRVGMAITNPNSILQVAGPIATAINTSAKTTAYTVVATDSTIQADASGGTFQVTLPTAASITGRQYTIKRINATNNVTVGCAGAETIDGAATKTLGNQWAALTVQSNGTNWIIVNLMGTVS